jgi:hypothetical protein
VAGGEERRVAEEGRGERGGGVWRDRWVVRERQGRERKNPSLVVILLLDLLGLFSHWLKKKRTKSPAQKKGAKIVRE